MSAPKTFRPDIEGLRAIAITSVVLYHAGVTQLTGGFIGVDLFFVLSGFLISGMLVREIETTGRVHLANFWARRVRRLLPAATVVLILTALFSAIVLPPTLRTETANAITSAALYSANWFFASNSLDYLAAEDAPSPVLHFWSLGVEEQFYLVWPLLLLVLGMLAHRYGWSLRKIFAALAALIWTGSFAASLYFSTAAQPIAFFSAPTRFWQLATGAFLAIAAPAITRLPRWLRATGQAVGVAGLLLAIAQIGEFVNRGNVYPGWAALFPTLATALIVGGGMRGTSDGPTWIDRLLTTKVFQWLGGLSYSWYLWHWPVLVLWHARFGEGTLAVNLMLISAALIFAWITHITIENPIRFWAPLQKRAGASLAIGGILMSATVVAAAAVSLTDSRHLETAKTGFTPLPSAARLDRSEVYARDCVVPYHDVNTPEGCIFGDVTAAQRLVLIGDSHAASFFPAIDSAAKVMGYALDVRIKLGCTTADVEQWHFKFNRTFTECTEWRQRLMADLKAHPADAVIVVNADNPPPQVFANGELLDAKHGHVAWIQGYARTLRMLQSSGATVIALRDNPRVPGIIADCVAMHLEHPERCNFPRAFGLTLPAADMKAAALVPGVRTVDLTDAICDNTTCYAVRNHFLAWQKGNHYTATFAKSLAPEMTERLRIALRP